MPSAVNMSLTFVLHLRETWEIYSSVAVAQYSIGTHQVTRKNPFRKPQLDDESLRARFESLASRDSLAQVGIVQTDWAMLVTEWQN